MAEGVAAALIAALASLAGSVLTFVVGLRKVRRQVSTPDGSSLGQLVEARMDRLEGRLDRVESSLSDVREHLAYESGRAEGPIWTRRPSAPP